MDILSRLFGSESKVKIIRLFIFNPDHTFNTHEVSARVKTDTSKVRRELSVLEKMKFIKRRVHGKKGGNNYSLNHEFPYLLPLQTFLVSAEPLQPKEIIKRVSRIGSIKLIIISGVFIQDPESRVDMLIVGDNIRKGSLENTIKILESEIGRELKYAYFTVNDFKYRLSMFDKLVRDILDYPHRKILNRLGEI